MNRWAICLLLLTLAPCGCGSSEPDEELTKLVFHVGPEGGTASPTELESVKTVVQNRLIQSEFLLQYRGVTTHAPDQLFVVAPKLTTDEIEVLARIVTRPATLEFAIVANPIDHEPLIAAARSATDTDPLDRKGTTAWIPVGRGADGQRRDLYDDGRFVFREVDRDGESVQELLVVLGPPPMRITDALLKNATKMSSDSGEPIILFQLNERGQYLMKNLTMNNLPTPGVIMRRLAIILDGSVLSAPSIQESFGDGVIEGIQTQAELDELAIALSGGRLPVPVQFVEAEPPIARRPLAVPDSP